MTGDREGITGSARATGGTNRGEGDYLLISLPPGFVGVFTQDSLVWQAVHPDGVDRCSARTGGAFASPPGDSALGGLGKWFAQAIGVGYSLPDFLAEDKAICERIQRGYSGDFAPGRLLPVERVVADFGHYLNWRLNDVEPPEAHSERHLRVSDNRIGPRSRLCRPRCVSNSRLGAHRNSAAEATVLTRPHSIRSSRPASIASTTHREVASRRAPTGSRGPSSR